MKRLNAKIIGLIAATIYSFSHYLIDRNSSVHDFIFFGILFTMVLIVGKLFDDNKRLNKNLLEKVQLFSTLFHKNHAKILLIDPDNGDIISANDSACNFYGFNKEEFKEKKIWELNVLSMEETLGQLKVTKEKKYQANRFQHRLANGDIKDVEVYSGLVPYENREIISSIINDISDKRNVEKQIEYLVNYDILTNLPNRNALHNYMEDFLSNRPKGFTIFFIDINRFKWFNSSLGNDFGDFLLQEVSKRVKNQLPNDQCFISRFGDDEFIVILKDFNKEIVDTIIKKILRTFHQPINIKGKVFFVSLTIGISQYPESGTNKEILLKSAETAMFAAKRQMIDFKYYSPEIEDEFSLKINLENELSEAVANEEFIIHYQPQINLLNNEIVGIEALVRWNHPKLGLISPLKFIPIAEETGLIHPIGQWVLEEACRQNKKWQEEGFPAIPIAVNVSSKQLEDASFKSKVVDTLNKTGLEAKYLDIELTESIMQSKGSIDKLVELKGLGVQLSIDDFGTGYSSLALLKNLPVDKIKVDKQFIRNIGFDQKATAIIRTIIDMGKHLNIDILTEGIEKEEEVDFLKSASCYLGQGYFLSIPLPQSEIKDYLTNQYRQLAL